MPIVIVSRTAYGADAIAYCRGHGRGHNGHQNRNLRVSAINMLPDKAIPFEQQMKVLWNKASARHTTQLLKIMISFAKYELNPDNPDDVETAVRIAQEFVRENYPDRQAAIFCQADGVGSCLHNHIVINSVRSTDFKGMKKDEYHALKVRTKVEEISARHIKPRKHALEPERENKAVQVLREKNDAARRENAVIQADNEREIRQAKEEGREPVIRELKPVRYLWQVDLKERILKAAGRAWDEESFAHELRLSGVELLMQEEKGRKKNGEQKKRTYLHRPTKTQPEPYYVYQLTDITGFQGQDMPARDLKSKSHKLGANYMPDAIKKLFIPPPEQEREVPVKLLTEFPVVRMEQAEPIPEQSKERIPKLVIGELQPPPLEEPVLAPEPPVKKQPRLVIGGLQPPLLEEPVLAPEPPVKKQPRLVIGELQPPPLEEPVPPPEPDEWIPAILKERPASQRLEAENRAKLIAWDLYIERMSWDKNKLRASIKGDTPSAAKMRNWVSGAMAWVWDTFSWWRERERQELKELGETLAAIIEMNTRTEDIRVNMRNLRQQFDGFWKWLEARKRKQERLRMLGALEKDWSLGDENGGKDGKGLGE